MVRRFGSGEVQQVSEGRVFRGAPREQPREEVIISETTTQQRQEISNELNSVINERNRIEAELERLNPADGSRIGSISVIKQLQSQSQGLTERINFLIGLRDNLQEGQIVEDLQGAFREGERVGESTARKALIRKESISQKVREEKPRITVSEQFRTANVLTSEDIARRRATIRGEEPPLIFSGTGLSPQEARAREALVDIGFIKEQSTINAIQAEPLLNRFTLGGKIDIRKTGTFDTSTVRPAREEKAFIPTRFSNIKILSRELAFGRQKVSAIRGLAKEGGLFFLKAGEKITNIKIPEGTKAFRVQRVLQKKAQLGPFSITRGQAAQFLGDIALIQTFSPLIKTATAKQESQFTEVFDPVTGRGRFVKKADLDKLKLQEVLKTFKEAPRAKQIEFIRRGFEKQVYIDPSSFAKDIVKTTKFLAAAGLSPKQSNIILKGVFGKSFTATIPKTATVSAPTTSAIPQIRTAQLERVGEVTSVFAGQGLYERTDFVSPRLRPQQLQGLMSLQTPSLNQQTRSLQTVAVASAISSASATTTKQTPIVVTTPTTRQTPVQQQSPKLTTPKLTFSTPTFRDTRGRFPRNPARRTPILIPLILPFRRPEKVKKAKSFEVFGRRRGVFRPIGRAVTQRQAFSIGRTFAATTLGATFKVTGPKTVGTPRGFRRKETTQGTLFIERRSLRLDTPTEIKSIQRARRKKKKKRNK